VMYVFMHYSLDVDTWLPLRRRRHLELPLESAPPLGSQRPGMPPVPKGPARFALYFAPPDLEAAANIVTILECGGHHLADPGEPGTIQVLLLSNATPVDFAPLVTLAIEQKPTVCVLLSAIAVADDREAFHQYQWIDYRRRDNHEIEALARWLNEGVPKSLTVSAPDVRPPSATILPVGALFVSIPLTALSSLLMYHFLLRLLEIPIYGYQGLPVAAELTEAGSAVFAALTAAAIRGRLFTFWTYAVGMTCTFALLLSTGVLQGTDAGGVAVVLIIGGCLWFMSAAEMRKWLLARRLPWRHSATLAPQPAWRFLARQALILFVAALAFAIIWASSDGIRRVRLRGASNPSTSITGVAQDSIKARECHEKAADAGHSGIVNLNDNGQGGTEAYAKVREMAERFALSGNAAAMNVLGILYVNGQGVAQDYAWAHMWFEKSAAGGEAEAMRHLGFLYANGQGVAQDYIKAREWYEKGAAACDFTAMTSLGFLYANGQGVTRDYAKAREWYEKAATAGNNIAMRELGSLYYNGQGVAQDYAKAREWFEKGAATGDAGAMTNLGVLYAEGQGVVQDYVKARELFEMAGGAQALGSLAWYTLLAREPADALSAAERALAIDPSLLWIEGNRAHALMFLGRAEEARALYLAHKDKPIPENNKVWQQVIGDDFAALRKVGFEHPQMNEIEAALGIAKP